MRPVVLVPKNADCDLAPEIAPDSGEIGAMLPYSPLHHLLLADFGAPLVATSGNISGEPVLTDNSMAETRLAAVADGFLHHDRPIVRPADDPVYRVIGSKPRPIRLGRGNAPLEIDLPFSLPRPLLALGGHLKNTVALGWGNRAVVSPHLGDMDTSRGLGLLKTVAADLQSLYGVVRRLFSAMPIPATRRRVSPRSSGLPVDRDISPRGPRVGAGWRIPSEQRLADFHLGRRGLRPRPDNLGRRGAARAAGALAPRGDGAALCPARRGPCCPRAVAQRARPVLGRRKGLGDLPAGDDRLAPRVGAQAQLPADLLDRPPVRRRCRLARPCLAGELSRDRPRAISRPSVPRSPNRSRYPYFAAPTAFGRATGDRCSIACRMQDRMRPPGLPCSMRRSLNCCWPRLARCARSMACANWA